MHHDQDRAAMTADQIRDEDDTCDREWARHRALLWAAHGWMSKERACFESLRFTNFMRRAMDLPPLEWPL